MPITARRRRATIALAALLLLLPLLTPLGDLARAEVVQPVADGATASGFAFRKADPIGCAVAPVVLTTPAYSRDDCGWVDFDTTGVEEGDTVQGRLLDAEGDEFDILDASDEGDGGFRFSIEPEAAWPSGEIGLEVVVGDVVLGTSQLFLNYLTATVAADDTPDGSPYRSGDPVPVSGTIAQLDTDPLLGSETETGVPATFDLVVDLPDGTTNPVPGGPFTAAADGTFTATIPAAALAGVEGLEQNDFEVSAAVRVVDAAFDDAGEAWAAAEAGSGDVTIVAAPTGLVLQNRYTSPVGWVKPDEAYTYRVFVKNYTENDATNVEVTIPAPPSSEFSGATPFTGSGTADAQPDEITWTIGTLAAFDEAPTVATLVIDAKAVPLDVDPEIVWKDLSSTATLTYTGGPADLTDTTRGPKVIPPTGGYESARYGDKPFPVVPAEYVDRKHLAQNTGDALDRAINDEQFEGSTVNLYKEMSFNQLFPHGTVPSSGIATADFEYDAGFDFSTPDRSESPNCTGVTFAEDPTGAAIGSPLYGERIRDGWYQLPGDTNYYGQDDPVFTVNSAGSIDGGCGQTGKSVFDAAQIADPEIDYNDYDFDKDGVVDFFMLVFVGCGGNLGSQTGPALCGDYAPTPYDNIWPHSSTLEDQYTEADTGLRGYVSDDQLEDLHGTPQCWINEDRAGFDDCEATGGSGDDGLPVPVRVGPYNVNPETAIESASVISHEFGHHLGLPDFYSDDNTYGDFNLMAADYSQHMTVFGKQDLGRVVPDVLQPGETRDVEDWDEIKDDTGEIHWETPDGTPYTLSDANGDQNIHNGEAYGLELPARDVIDPALVEEGASAPHVWWSGRGNDFGCSPDGAHNLDIWLPALADVPADTPITLTLKHGWDIEWDYDYGFVLTSTDGAEYTSHPSANGYTTPASNNPNTSGCLAALDNGLTGQSGSYAEGTQDTDRLPVIGPTYDKEPVFLEDEFDISDLAGGEQPVLRFSYSTDAGFDRPGWFIDDVEVKAGDEVIYSSDFEDDTERGTIFSGGCDPDGFNVAARCTDGWNWLDASADNPADHAYYLELRDQNGFDFDGHGQSDRGDTTWAPGVLLEYTDEAHGYGNNGVPAPPAQHYLDSQPVTGDQCTPENDGPCADASFTGADGDSHFDDTVDADSPGGWIDNFSDPESPYGDDGWHFDYGCLSLDVTSMDGEAIGPEPLPADLTADATITANEGCQPFAYGSPTGELVGDDSACAPSKVPPTPYADARGAAPHAENIACIGWYGITQGKGDINGDGQPDYDPAGNVTRGQMASFIARLALEAGIDLPVNPPDAFPDDNGTEHEPAINALAAIGIVEGRPSGNYVPDEAVRRDQMASFIARLHREATGEPLESTKNWFTDDDGSVHEPNINAIADLGITRGTRDVDGDGKIDYEPALEVSRAQMASFIARDLGLLVDDGFAYQGGASIELTAAEAAAGDDLAGVVSSNKRVDGMTVSGCGLDEATVPIGSEGGDFTVGIPADREPGPCTLSFELTTSREPLNEDGRPTQVVSHTFSVLVG